MCPRHSMEEAAKYPVRAGEFVKVASITVRRAKSLLRSSRART
jgi:hypothetical protein